VELIDLDERDEAQRDEHSSDFEQDRRDLPDQEEPSRDGPLSQDEGLVGTDAVAKTADKGDEGLNGEEQGEGERAQSARPDVDGGAIAGTAEEMGYPREVVPPTELVIRVSSGEGTELPHWADPPTGEVPRAITGSKAQEDELQAWRLLGSRGLHWRDDVNDWSDGPGMEDLVDHGDEHGIAEAEGEGTGRPFSFDDDFERLERERTERAEGAAAESAGEGTVEGYEPSGTGTVASGDDETRSLFAGDPVEGHGSPDEGDGPKDAGGAPAEVAAVSSMPPRAPLGLPTRRQRVGTGRNLRKPGRAGAVASGAVTSAARHAKRPFDARADRGASGGTGRDVGAAVATGIGLVALFVICYLIAPAALLALSAVAILGCALEAFAMFQRAGFRPATLLGAVGSTGAVLAAYWRGPSSLSVVLVVVLCASLVWYLARVVEARPVVNVAVTVFGFVWVGILGAFAGLLLAAPRGEHLFIGAVIPTVLADLAAWFAGSRFGSHPLAPATSPSKTWEGFAAGAIAALVAGAVIGNQVSPWGGVRHGLELGLVIAVVAPVGDLVQSMVKRDLRLKDSSSLLPGHGGLLDRFDSLLLALPATYFLATALHLA
jgi:phosphatidate cytidylyltransferase